MNKEPKYVYLFYVIGKFCSDELKEWLEYDKSFNEEGVISGSESPAGEDIYFYAFTTSKRMAKSFMGTRNMSRFHMEKRLYREWFETDQEYDEFRKRFHNCEMVEKMLFTRNYSDKIESPCVKVELCITQFEFEYLNNRYEEIDDEMYEAYEKLEIVNIIFDCLGEKMKDALADIGFISFVKYLEAVYNRTSETDVPEVNLDEVQLILDYFGELFV